MHISYTEYQITYYEYIYIYNSILYYAILYYTILCHTKSHTGTAWRNYHGAQSLLRTLACTYTHSGKDKGGPSEGGFLNNKLFPG